MGSKDKADNKEIKLANQIGKVTAATLVGIFFVLIVAVALLTSITMFQTLEDGLFESADNTANRIESVFSTTTASADNIYRYVRKSYQVKDYGLTNMAGEIVSPEDSRSYTSMIFNTNISELTADVEKYLLETMRSTVLSDNCVIGAAVMFEPYMLDENVKDYAFFVDASLGENDPPTPFGEYSVYSKEMYYQKAAEELKTVYTEPYLYEGQKIISCATPIMHNNKFMGVILSDILEDSFADFITINEEYPSMYTTIYNADNIIIYDSDSEADVGKKMDEFYKNADELQDVKNQLAKGEAFSSVTTRENGTKMARYFQPLKAGSETWWAMTAVSQADQYSAILRLILMLILICVASLTLVVAVVVTLLKKKLKPIDQVVAAAEEISKGNLNIEMDITSRDEIGKLGRAFRSTIDGLKRIIGDIDYLLGAIAGGNFAVKTMAEDAYVGEYNSILMSMRTLNTNLSITLEQIVGASDQVALGSAHMAQSAQSLSEGATEQAGAVEELTATIEGVAATAIGNAEQADEAYKRSEDFEREAESSGEEMAKLNEAMESISETSKQIAQIVNEIEDIASQTNLLSLNASIEAARAGEAGRGFAVVAGQIGKLAADSAQSAVNTRKLIGKALEEINKGSVVTENTAKSITRVIDGIQQLAKATKEMSESSITQAETMKQIKQGVDQISGVVQDNSATAEETSATSQELSAQADNLKGLVGKFNLKKE